VDLTELNTINELAHRIHRIAVEHGWWERPRDFPEVAALIHSEVSEALEEYRQHGTDKLFYRENGKPEGLAVELADAVIRIFDYLVYLGVNVDETIRQKVAHNELRPYRHGGKRA